MNDKITIEIDRYDVDEFRFLIKEHRDKIGYDISYGPDNDFYKEFFTDILEQIERQMS